MPWQLVGNLNGSERIAATVFDSDPQSLTWTNCFVAQTQDSDTLENASRQWQPDTHLDWSPDLELIELQIWDQVGAVNSCEDCAPYSWSQDDDIWTFI